MKKIALITVAAILFIMLAACSRTVVIPPEATPVTPEILPDEEKEHDGIQAEPLAAVAAEDMLAEMSLREKVCQLFITYPYAVENITGSMETGLQEYPVCGFIYSEDNLKNLGTDGVLQSVEQIQEWAKIDLLICADEEGGRVRRLMNALGTTRINAMYSYKDQGADVAYQNAATVAKDMQSYGFNTDMAPVADVWSNNANTVIGDRAYSDDFNQAAELVGSAVRGFKDSGLICTLKHFPGHGNTFEDSHYSTATVMKTLEELKENEFLPFMEGIENGADMVMIGHLTVTDIDDVPATVSHKIVTELLREQLDYSGVVISDGLEMSAVDGYSDGELEVRALEAGIDILLGPLDLETSVKAVEDAVSRGRITMERINESVFRVLKMKLENGII